MEMVKDHMYLFLSALPRYSPARIVQIMKRLAKSAVDVFAEFYSAEEIIQMPLKELALLVAKTGKNRSPQPEKIAREIEKAAKESYRLRPDLADSVQFILGNTIINMRALKSFLKEVSKAIALEMKGFSNPLSSIKGIGPVYAAGIFASKRALMLTLRKLVRLVFALLSENRLYEPARAFQCAQPSC